MKFSIFALTNSGLVRAHNEDDFAVCKDLSANDWSFKRGETTELSEAGALVVVADGMGGTHAGEVASNLAQLTVKETFESDGELPDTPGKRETFLKSLILDAHDRIVQHQHEHLDTAGMGTTLVIGWLVDDLLHVAWSGDSRCYLYNDDIGLERVTEDHSMIWEMVKAGKMTAEEARVHPESNVITQSLGTEGDPPDPDAVTVQLAKGDRVLLCSDGLNGMVSDQVIEDILQQRKGTAESCNELVDAANEAGGEDNITSILIDIAEGPTRDLKQDPGKTVIIKTQKSRLSRGLLSALLAFVLIGGAYVAFDTFSNDSSGEYPPAYPETPQDDEKGTDETDRDQDPADAGVSGSSEPAEQGVEQEPTKSEPEVSEPGESGQTPIDSDSEPAIESVDSLNGSDEDSAALPADPETDLPDDTTGIEPDETDSLRTPVPGQPADPDSTDT
jgi:serine/threonine protein phosphatase PrpC